MAITIADGFQYLGKKSLDSRTSYATLALMKAVSDSNINEGCLAYCEETDKYYKFLSSNTVDTDTGKWREYSSGGGSSYTAGDGINIEDDEISTDNMQSGDIADVTYPLPTPGPGVTSLGGLTDVALQEPANGETLVYNSTTHAWENGENSGKTYTAGDGINIDENYEISTDNMQSEDMEEVVETLPGIASRYHKYSTTEQIVGEWINGETIYEKTIDFGSLPNNSTKSIAHGITNLGAVIDLQATSFNSDYAIGLPYINMAAFQNCVEIYLTPTDVAVRTSADKSVYTSCYVVIRYTKS